MTKEQPEIKRMIITIGGKDELFGLSGHLQEIYSLTGKYHTKIISVIYDTDQSVQQELLSSEDIIKDLEWSLDWYKKRTNMLQCWQSLMRDPERKIVCDILANGFTMTSKQEVDEVQQHDVILADKIRDEILPNEEELKALKQAVCHALNDRIDGFELADNYYHKLKFFRNMKRSNKQEGELEHGG